MRLDLDSRYEWIQYKSLVSSRKAHIGITFDGQDDSVKLVRRQNQKGTQRSQQQKNIYLMNKMFVFMLFFQLENRHNWTVWGKDLKQ